MGLGSRSTLANLNMEARKERPRRDHFPLYWSIGGGVGVHVEFGEGTCN